MSDGQHPLLKVVGAVAVVIPLIALVSDCSGDGDPPAPYVPPRAIDRIVMPSDGSCYTRETAMGAIRPTALWEPAPPPFCTDRPDITDWVTVEPGPTPRYFAFDSAGCLAAWTEVPCP